MNTLFIGKVSHRFSVVGSTQDVASDLIAKSRPPEGTVVRTDSQSAGRGQFGARWQSAPGENLLLSIILYPTFLDPSEQFQLSQAMALAVADTVGPPPDPLPRRGSRDGSRNSWHLHGYKPRAGGDITAPPPWEGAGGRPSVKWPNDIYLGSRKVAGILIQNTLSGGWLSASIVGIGLNVNQTAFDPELPNPTSLALEGGHALDLEEVYAALLESIERRYLELRGGGAAAIVEAYHARLYRLGEWTDFQRASDAAVFRGRIVGVAPNGALRVETTAGEESFSVGQVRFA